MIAEPSFLSYSKVFTICWWWVYSGYCSGVGDHLTIKDLAAFVTALRKQSSNWQGSHPQSVFSRLAYKK